ncbi:MAG: hypothetical protein HYS98_04840 [Deltaproteobacteria bacterium]|nr:hypothetical protein [Deltaproteobacteria bacterium]
MFGLFRRKQKEVQPPAPQQKKIKVLPIGTVTHFYNKIQVAIIDIENDHISLGDILFIKGPKTRFRQRVKSIEYNHQKISKAPEGYQIGLQVGARAFAGDKIFKELN